VDPEHNVVFENYVFAQVSDPDGSGAVITDDATASTQFDETG
jgi:hypothetical protein